MSESIPEYILRGPLKLIDVVHNDMGEPPEYLFARQDASEHEVIGCGGDYVKQVFMPLDRQATQAKIIDLTQQYFGQDEAYDNEQKEFANEIMRLFGLENPERQDNE